jgi:hypothetical protein
MTSRQARHRDYLLPIDLESCRIRVEDESTRFTDAARFRPTTLGLNTMGWPWKGTNTPRCVGMELVLLLLLLLRIIPVLLVQAQAGGGRIVLSEFMIDPQSAASELDGTYIELYNAGNASVDLLNQQLLVNNFYATFVMSVIVQPQTCLL